MIILSVNNIVVFASGSGTNFQAIIDAVSDGRINAEITGLITSRKDIGAAGRAADAGIPSAVLHPANFRDSTEFASAILNKLKLWQPDIIVLAGYLLKIPDAVITEFPGKIINIHPSLLPKYGGKSYYGERVHRAVLDAGERESGCTVHVVTNDYDQGPVIAQEKVNVFPGDTPETLAKRILQKEHELLPAIIQKILTKKTDS